MWLSAETSSVNGMPQCVCLVDASGNRTMRPCLSNAVKIQVLVTIAFLYFYGFMQSSR